MEKTRYKIIMIKEEIRKIKEEYKVSDKMLMKALEDLITDDMVM